MASLSEIRAEVVRIVQDGSYSSTDIDRMINQSLRDICGGVVVEWPQNNDQTISQPMPGLYTISDVDTTSNAYASLPNTHQREVVFVSGGSGTEITIYDAFGDFRMSFPSLDMAGSVVGCAVKGGLLYYQGIPATTETLKVHHHIAPSTLSENADVPEGLPVRFHMTLLVYDVSLKIFQEIYEEDMKSHAVITSYERKRMTELIALDSSIDQDNGSVIFK